MSLPPPAVRPATPPMPRLAGPFSRAWGRGCLRSLLAALVGAPLGVAMVAFALWVARHPPPGEPGSALRNLLLALAAVLPVAVILTGVAGLVLLVVRRRAGVLDPPFARLGARGRQHAPVTRSWHGEHRGRRLDAWFSKGPKLEIYLDADARTRLSVGRPGRTGRQIAAAAGRRPLDPPPAALPDVSVFAEDEPWARRLLALPEAGAAVRSLLDAGPRVFPVVTVHPDAVVYLRAFDKLPDLGGDAIDRWTDDLLALASAVDAVGPSATGAAPSRIETWARHHRGRTLRRALLAIGIGGILVFAALVAFVAWLGIGPQG